GHRVRAWPEAGADVAGSPRSRRDAAAIAEGLTSFREQRDTGHSFAHFNATSCPNMFDCPGSIMRRIAAFLALSLAATAPAFAQSCQDPSKFPAWLDKFKQEAAAAGISAQTIHSSLDGLTYDPRVIGYDRNQKVFKQSFEQFSGRMVNSFRISKG